MQLTVRTESVLIYHNFSADYKNKNFHLQIIYMNTVLSPTYL